MGVAGRGSAGGAGKEKGGGWCWSRRDTRGKRGYDGEVKRGYDGSWGAGVAELGARGWRSLGRGGGGVGWVVCGGSGGGLGEDGLVVLGDGVDVVVGGLEVGVHGGDGDVGCADFLPAVEVGAPEVGVAAAELGLGFDSER